MITEDVALTHMRAYLAMLSLAEKKNYSLLSYEAKPYGWVFRFCLTYYGKDQQAGHLIPAVAKSMQVRIVDKNNGTIRPLQGKAEVDFTIDLTADDEDLWDSAIRYEDRVWAQEHPATEVG